MGAKAYLTIDDSPSTRLDDMIDFLHEREIPALFFCRGDMLQANPVAAIRAVQKGFILGNHTFSHKRASECSIDEFIIDIEKTERMIDHIYAIAEIDKPGQYFRFPHVDRGCAGEILDFDVLSDKDRNEAHSAFTDGLNTRSDTKPDEDALEKKEKLQHYLTGNGYTAPFEKVDVPWYTASSEIQNASDCLFTFSTSDWMMTSRHKGKWPYKTLDDLKRKIDDDPYLLTHGGIVLAHDQSEIMDTTLALIDHMHKKGISFLPIHPPSLEGGGQGEGV